MVENINVGQTYWFVHTGILTEYPKKVTVTDISGRVVMFDEYVGNEKFAEMNVVKEGLFDVENEAYDYFMGMMFNGETQFIERNTPKFKALYDLYVEKAPHILIH